MLDALDAREHRIAYQKGLHEAFTFAAKDTAASSSSSAVDASEEDARKAKANLFLVLNAVQNCASQRRFLSPVVRSLAEKAKGGAEKYEAAAEKTALEVAKEIAGIADEALKAKAQMEDAIDHATDFLQSQQDLEAVLMEHVEDKVHGAVNSVTDALDPEKVFSPDGLLAIANKATDLMVARYSEVGETLLKVKDTVTKITKYAGLCADVVAALVDPSGVSLITLANDVANEATEDNHDEVTKMKANWLKYFCPVVKEELYNLDKNKNTALKTGYDGPAPRKARFPCIENSDCDNDSCGRTTFRKDADAWKYRCCTHGLVGGTVLDWCAGAVPLGKKCGGDREHCDGYDSNQDIQCYDYTCKAKGHFADPCKRDRDCVSEKCGRVQETPGADPELRCCKEMHGVIKDYCTGFSPREVWDIKTKAHREVNWCDETKECRPGYVCDEAQSNCVKQ